MGAAHGDVEKDNTVKMYSDVCFLQFATVVEAAKALVQLREDLKPFWAPLALETVLFAKKRAPSRFIRVDVFRKKQRPAILEFERVVGSLEGFKRSTLHPESATFLPVSLLSDQKD